MYIYTFTKFININAFQTSPVKKERKKQLDFKFQAETFKIL